jgi:uncharacterized protein
LKKWVCFFQCRSKLCLQRLIPIMGLLIMTSVNANGAPSFKLKAANDYFGDQKTRALLTASLAGDLTKARHLVAEGANPNDEGPRSNRYNRLRLLHYTIAAKNQRAVKVLLEVGADPELSVQGFGSAFDFASTLRDMEMLSLLLDMRPVKALSRNTVENLLFESVTDNSPQCLEILFKRGVPIDLPDSADYTVMMRAMDAQDYDLAEWLLLKGASVFVATGGGVTPAYSVEFHLKKFKPGSPTYNKVLHLKKLMEERGAVFPAPSPEEVRAQRTKG